MFRDDEQDPPIPPTMCGKSHKTKRHAGQKYNLLYAAKDGCLACVRHYIEVDKMDASCTSDSSSQYTCLQFAEYSRDRGVTGAADVVEYLKTHCSATQTEATDSTVVEWAPRCSGKDAEMCADWRKHKPKKNQNNDYWLLNAASVGCLQCVRRFIEKDGMSAKVESANQKYTLLDCAIWARDHYGIEAAADVITYLTDNFPSVKATATRNTRHGRKKIS